MCPGIIGLGFGSGGGSIEYSGIDLLKQAIGSAKFGLYEKATGYLQKYFSEKNLAPSQRMINCIKKHYMQSVQGDLCKEFEEYVKVEKDLNHTHNPKHLKLISAKISELDSLAESLSR